MDFSCLHSSIPPLPNARQLIPIPLEDGNRHRDPRRGCVVLEAGRPGHLAGAVSSCSFSSLVFNLRGTWFSSAHFFSNKSNSFRLGRLLRPRGIFHIRAICADVRTSQLPSWLSVVLDQSAVVFLAEGEGISLLPCTRAQLGWFNSWVPSQGLGLLSSLLLSLLWYGHRCLSDLIGHWIGRKWIVWTAKKPPNPIKPRLLSFGEQIFLPLQWTEESV